MSEDQDLLARIGRLAGHINLHKAQPSPPPSVACEEATSSAFRPQVTKGQASWKPLRAAPYGARARGAQRRHPTSHSLVLHREKPGPQPVNLAPLSATPDGLEALQPAAAYVSKRGRHKQLINASVLDKVTQQRKHAMEETQQRKVLIDDHQDHQRMSQYMDCRYAHIRVNPSAPVCKNFAGLGYCGEGADCSNRHVYECPDYANTGTCRKKHCGLPHVDRAGQIRRYTAQKAETGNIAETNDGDISSEEDDDVDTDGEDIDSDDLTDSVVEDVDARGRQALAEQHDFVGF
ncbi:MAG: hypothetical protein Q9184_004418 [Pyrenodesmia sp. 2 TL-2023]